MKLLRRADLSVKVTVIEQNACVGGLAASVEYEGLYLDHGSHRLHPATSPDILQDIRVLLGPDLLDRPRHGRIRLLGRFVKFPLHPLDLALHLPPTFLMGIVRDTVTKFFCLPRRTHASFAEALLDGLGPTICRTFYFPYARKLWGLEPERLAAVQAQKRVSANSVVKIIRRILSILPGFGATGAGRFFYPRHGFGQISQALAQEVKRLGGEVRLSTRVQAINIEHGRPGSVLVGPSKAPESEKSQQPLSHGETITTDFVFSTIPVTILVNCLRPKPPSEVSQACQQIHHRGMVLCYLVLETDQFTPYDAHYIPESELIFSRLSEPKNYSAAQEPRGLTGLCVEIPCAVGDETWNTSVDELRQRVRTDLARAGLPVQCPIRTVWMERVPRVYPIYDLGFEARWRTVDNYLGQIPGLISLGRQGLFAHDNTHHTMEMAYRASACLQPGLAWNASLWGEYRQEFEKHVVVD
jgi:protoporphyrinogen oxidase